MTTELPALTGEREQSYRLVCSDVLNWT